MIAPKMLSIVSVAVLFFLSGCMSFRATYDIGLSEVERPVSAAEQYGDQEITKVQEGGVEKYYFEDDMVKIIWIPTSSQLSFMLTNKTDHSIKILWDEASYVDADGVGHRVMHAGVKYVDRNGPQPPTIVVRRGSVGDMVFPADYAYYLSGSYGGWRERPLFPNSVMGGSKEEDALRISAEANIGKSVQVLLPLQIEDVTNEYIFTFKVNGAKVEEVSTSF